MSFEDIRSALIVWRREKTGEEWTLPLVTAMEYSADDDLRAAYWTLFEQMEQDYIAALRAEGKAIGYVYADGYLQGAMDPSELRYETVARLALANMYEVRLGDVSLTADLDDTGRLTGAGGDVALIFVNLSGGEHTVRFTFTAGAGAFGTSTVQAAETLRDEESVELPGEIEIDGITYKIDRYGG